MFLLKDMRINVKAKPNSREEKVIKVNLPGQGDTEFIVFVKEPPIHGLANKAIIHALASHLNVPQSGIRIISGHTSKQKVIEIP